MVLPRFVSAALAGEPLVVHDDGAQIRCFAHVDDVVGGVCQLMDTPDAAGKVYNIGSDVPITILDLAQRVIQRTGSKSEIRHQSYADAYDQSFEDIRRRVPELDRIKNAIGFSPRKTLDHIIDDVAQSMQ